jgi:hypothetical protein
MYQDIIDAAGFTVWARMQAGQPLTMALCREVTTELGCSTAAAERVYYQVRQWRSGISQTRRLGGR